MKFNLNLLEDQMIKVKSLFVFLAVFFLTACGSPDPDIVYLTEQLQSEDAMSEKQAKCLAKGLKKGLKPEQFEKYMAMERGEGEAGLEDMGFVFEILPLSLAAGVKCGIPMDME